MIYVFSMCTFIFFADRLRFKNVSVSDGVEIAVNRCKAACISLKRAEEALQMTLSDTISFFPVFVFLYCFVYMLYIFVLYITTCFNFVSITMALLFCFVFLRSSYFAVVYFMYNGLIMCIMPCGIYSLTVQCRWPIFFLLEIQCISLL